MVPPADPAEPERMLRVDTGPSGREQPAIGEAVYCRPLHPCKASFRGSLARTMTRGVSRDAYLAANLIGNPDEVCEKVAAFEQAGLDHFRATLFVGNTVNEVRDQMRMFSRYVLPAFPA